jgi:glycosyltransferase involved in cell wall biosynthesis
MKILWICGLPRAIQRELLSGQDYGAQADWSWVVGHFPPPEEVELHVACRTARHTAYRQLSYKGAHIHLVPVKARARVFCLFQLDWLFYRRLVSRLAPDVTHGWGTEDAYSLVTLKLAPQRHVVQIQGNLNTYRRRVRMPWQTALAAWSERIALARARCVVAENEYSLNSALPMLRTKSVHVVEHPIRADFRTAPPSPGEAKQILFLGAIEERKGIWDALQAFRHGAPPDWTLVIIGNGPPELVANLRRLIRENGLESRVQHHPHLDTSGIIAQMQASSLFLLPTRIDTGPTALKEALSMGLWPVCYDNSGPGHYIRKFQFGNLAEDLNLEALTSVLREAIAAQPWQAPGQRAKIATHIRPHFDPATIWPQLIQMYRQIMLENPSAGAKS